MLPNFRYLDEAIRYLDGIRDEIKTNGQIIRQQQEILAKLRTPTLKTLGILDKVVSALDVINIGETSPKSKTRLNKKVDLKINKIVVPNLKKLESQYKMLNTLYAQRQTLEALDTQIRMQFPDARDLKSALSNIKEIRAQVEQQMKEVFSYLSEVANAHVPTDFRKYVSAVAQELEENVTFAKSSQYLYVNVSNAGSIVFTHYILLENAVNDEGETANLYISLQLVCGVYNERGESEEPSIKVFLMHEFEMPAVLMKDRSGVSVGNAADAVRTISNFLDIENFGSSLGVIPLAIQLKVDPELLTKDTFSYRDYISKIEFGSESGDKDTNSLIFVLRKDKGVTEETTEAIRQQLFLELKQMLKNSRTARLRSVIKKSNGRYNIIFKVQGIAGKKELSLYDVEFLKDKFDLSDSQLRRIVNVISQ